MRKSCFFGPARQCGYVLVLTIVMLAALTVAASFVSQKIASVQSLVKSEQQAFETQKRIDQALARLLFTMATALRSSEGFVTSKGTLRVDGRWYDAGDGVRVSVQDVRGLINLNGVQRDILERFLAGFGGETSQTAARVDSLLDYQDEDDLVRLQGAEKNEYASANLLPPRNAKLLSLNELGRVMGWQSWSSLGDPDGILRHSSVSKESYINPNTATWRTLSAAFGISAPEAKRLLESRRKDGLDLMALLAGTADPFYSPFVGFPSSSFVIAFNTRGMPWAQCYLLEATPGEATGPWRIAYGFRREVGKEEVPDALSSLPLGVDKNDTKRYEIDLPF